MVNSPIFLKYYVNKKIYIYENLISEIETFYTFKNIVISVTKWISGSGDVILFQQLPQCSVLTFKSEHFSGKMITVLESRFWWTRNRCQIQVSIGAVNANNLLDSFYFEGVWTTHTPFPCVCAWYGVLRNFSVQIFYSYKIYFNVL